MQDSGQAAIAVARAGDPVPPKRWNSKSGAWLFLMKREVLLVKILLWIVGIFALIGMLVVGGCFKLVF